MADIPVSTSKLWKKKLLFAYLRAPLQDSFLPSKLTVHDLTSWYPCPASTQGTQGWTPMQTDKDPGPRIHWGCSRDGDIVQNYPRIILAKKFIEATYRSWLRQDPFLSTPGNTSLKQLHHGPFSSHKLTRILASGTITITSRSWLCQDPCLVSEWTGSYNSRLLRPPGTMFVISIM